MKRIFSICTVLALMLFTAVSCSLSQGGKDYAAEVSTEIKADDVITIRLGEDVPESAVARLKDNISISPKVDFTVDLIDGQCICINPKEKLEYNATYKVSANVGKIMGEKSKVCNYQVSTLPPMIIFDFGKLTLAQDKDDLFYIEVGLTSSEPLDEKYLENGISVAKKSPVIWSHGEDGKSHKFIVESIVPQEKSSLLTITYNLPQYGAEGARSFTVPAKGEFAIVEAQMLRSPYRIELTFSGRLKKEQAFRELVTVPGGGKLRFSAEKNLLTVYPTVEAKSHQSVSVSKLIASDKGNTLNDDWDRTFNVPTDKPMIKFMSKGSILPLSGDCNLYFQAVNYQKASVRIKQIYENNVLQYFQENSFADIYSYTGNVARTIIDTTFVLGDVNSGKLSNICEYGLNVADLVNIQRGAIYRIEIRGDDPLVEFDEGYLSSSYYYGSYDDYKDRALNILVSDLSAIVKSSESGDYTIFVNNIITAAPVPGAKVQAFNNVNQPIAEGTTGGDGKFVCKVEGDHIKTVIVSKGEDRSYITVSGTSPISLSNFDVAGQSVSGGQKGYIFGERGVWRPGDDIYLTFMCLLEDGVLPANHPVTATLRNPQGQAISSQTSVNGCNGMYAFKFKTDPNAPTGNWEVEVRSGGQLYYKRVKIESVKPNNILINLSLNDKPAIPAKNIQGTIDAKWLIGTPAKELAAKVEMTLSRGNTSFDNYKGYVFEDRSREFLSETKEIYSGKTSESGRAMFNTSLGKRVSVPGMMNATFTTRIFEKSGDFSIDHCSAKISPYDTYIGIYAKESENMWGEMFLDREKINTVKLAAVDLKGSPKNAKVGVEIYKMGWNWWWSSSYSGLASYAKDSYNEPYKTFNVNITNGSGEFRLDLTSEQNGYYFIRVADTVGGHATSKVFLVSTAYDYYTNGAQESAAKLEMALDKDKYAVGETANIAIPSANGARVLVSLEKADRVINSFWVECKGDKTVIPVQIESGMSPNIYASFTLIQPYNRTDNDAPIRMFGVQRIDVEDASSHLYPVIDIADEVKPESEVTFKVSEKNGRTMSYVVALVDEGLLSLTRYKTPDPWNVFNATEALAVDTRDLYGLIIGAYGARMERLFAIGGDGENEETISNTKAERFKPVSMFLGPFTVKAKGRESHTVKLPQYIGKLRVMVIATDGRALGSVDKSLSVTKPLMVQATLPRVIGTDEEVMLPVTLFATKPDLGEVTVDIETNNMFSIIGGSAQKVKISKDGDEVVYFALKAPSLEGVATLTANAKCKADKASTTIEIDVRNPNPLTSNAKCVVLGPKKIEKISFPLAGRAGTNKAFVEASTIPPVDLSNRLEYLSGYPHGCIEQTVSAVFPKLYIGNVMALDDEQKASYEECIKAAISKLPSFAVNGGGFTYWPGTSAYAGANVWGSIYATHFMIEAEAKGYAVPINLKKSGIRYLKTIASGKSYDAQSRCYACYVLSLSGAAPRSDMNRMREDIAKYPSEAGWLLAAAYALDGKRDVAKSVLSEFGRRVSGQDNPFSSNFGSPDREKAIAAMTYKRLGDKTGAFKCVEDLSKSLNDRSHWMSTQSIAWALNAVADYAAEYAAGGVNVAVKSGSDKVTLKDKGSLVRKALNCGGSSALEVEVENKTDAPTYIVLSSTGIPEKGAEVAISNGLRLAVTYVAADGTEINPYDIGQATDFTVNAYVTNLNASVNYTNLVLSTVLPSGWEIRSERTGDMYQDIRDDRVYSYFDLAASATKVVKIRCTATYAGRYYLPSITCSAMYDETINAATTGGWAVVR